MFGSDDDNFVAVTITMADGIVFTGKVDGGATKNISTTLNREGGFVELRMPGGLKKQISKRYIMTAEREEDVKKPETLQAKDSTDPYTILGITPQDDADIVKKAYLNLCKKYHPDNYHGTDMPDELKNYVDQMFKLVNQSYRQVSQSARHAA